MIKKTFIVILTLFLVASHTYMWIVGVAWGMNLEKKIERALYVEQNISRRRKPMRYRYNSKEPMRPI